MIRLPLSALLGLTFLTACAEASGTAAIPFAELPAQQQICEGEREAARAEAGFQLQAAGTEYAGSSEAALARDMQDAQVADDIAAAAFAECMAGG